MFVHKTVRTAQLNVLKMFSSDSVYSTSARDPSVHLYYLSQIIVTLMLASPAVLSNVILLTTIYRDPDRNQLRRTPVTLLVVNLSVCDLLSGLVPGFATLYYDIALFHGRTRESLARVRIVIIIVGVLTTIVSSFTIAAMALDRFFAVSSPLQYKARVTKGKVKVFIAVSWIYALLFSCLAMVLSSPVFVFLYCHLNVTLPLIILPAVYWKTYRALRLHNNRVNNLAGDGREAVAFVHRNRERKTVAAFLLILVLFYLTFIPQLIGQNMQVLQPSYSEEESFRFFHYAANKIVLANSSLNPFIYAWRIPKYQRAFKAVFCRCGPRNRPRNTVAEGPMMMHRPANRTATRQPLSV